MKISNYACTLTHHLIIYYVTEVDNDLSNVCVLYVFRMYKL